eukprot:m.135445 g.135445  ORF g.135445 m.135445 type:complete len:243 (-) comp15993_c0_seq3:185-913(-)
MFGLTHLLLFLTCATMAGRFRGLVSKFSSGSDHLKVVKVGHPALQHASRNVTPAFLQSTAGKDLIEQMVAAMRAHSGCGLAAPQIGRNLQLFVMELQDADLESEARTRDIAQLGMKAVPLTVIANPRMTLSKKVLLHREGCLSVPDHTALVPRADAVKIEGLDGLTGKPITFTASKWTARILQHEVDHLHGKLYLDRMNRETYTHQDELFQHYDPNLISAECLTASALRRLQNLPAFDPATS